MPKINSEMTERQLAGAVDSASEDTDLTPSEKEFIVNVTKDESTATVYTEIGSVIRGLLKHPEFEIDEIRCGDTTEAQYVSNLSQWSDDGRNITGVRGTIPVGCLKVSGSGRSDDTFSRVVSSYTPSDSHDGGGHV